VECEAYSTGQLSEFQLLICFDEKNEERSEERAEERKKSGERRWKPKAENRKQKVENKS
jgi:hypothetical protein